MEYDLTSAIPAPEDLRSGDVLNVPYSGAAVALTLPAGQYLLEVWGAQGGSYSTYYGGKGGYSTGILTLADEATEIFVYVGGQPDTVSTNRTTVPGGFNGGGAGYNRYYSSTYTYGQGGGGATDIRILADTLYNRVIVAGGGGGSASVDAQTTKYGGGTSGGSPQSGYGASQTAGGTNGSFGVGGSATTGGSNYKYGSGGGGGGWYGGGACSSYSDSTNYRGYNGGGSGFVWTGANAPTGYALGDVYYLGEAQTIAGNASQPAPGGGTQTGHSGNGYARITVIAVNGVKAPEVSEVGTTFISLTWEAVEDVSVYRVYCNGALVAETSSTSARISGFSPDTQYSFYLVAVLTSGEQKESSEITARTNDRAAAPTGLALVYIEPDALHIRWTAASDAIQYNVYMGGVLQISTKAAEAVISGLQPETEYSVTVSAVMSDGVESYQSAPLTARTDWGEVVSSVRITGMAASPNPVDHNKDFVLTVTAVDEDVIRRPLLTLSDMFYSDMAYGG